MRLVPGTCIMRERQPAEIKLPTHGVRGGQPLVDIDDRDAVAEALGENVTDDVRSSRADR